MVCPKFSDAIKPFNIITSAWIDLARLCLHLVIQIFNKENYYIKIVAHTNLADVFRRDCFDIADGDMKRKRGELFHRNVVI